MISRIDNNYRSDIAPAAAVAAAVAAAAAAAVAAAFVFRKDVACN